MRVDKDLGTVAEGKLADLVILKQNPLENVRNLRTVETVLQGGRVLPIGYHRDYVNPIPRVTTVGIGTTTYRGPGEGNLRPQLATISQDVVPQGAKELKLTLKGRNFVPMSMVVFDRTPLETTFVSATELRAVVPASRMVVAGTYSISVWTPEPGGGESQSIPFFVKY
jgi:hypothetical protein